MFSALFYKKAVFRAFVFGMFSALGVFPENRHLVANKSGRVEVVHEA
jgi:hypothetical protein